MSTCPNCGHELPATILPEALTHLSPQQRTVFRHLGEGLAMRDIAAQMRISKKTVGTYQMRLRQVFNLRSTAALRACAAQIYASKESNLLQPVGHRSGGAL